MPRLKLTPGQITYATEGEGFPLILVPDVAATMADWSRQIPLLGELCRVITYVYHRPLLETPTSTPREAFVAGLVAVLDALGIERAYLAGYAGGGLTALHFAHRYPQRAEGLLLIGIDDDLAAVPLHEIVVPTCTFAGAEAATHVACAERLASRVPHGASRVIPDASTHPHQEQPLPLGHAMMDFLMHCERQRNLVRGASFLL